MSKRHIFTFAILLISEIIFSAPIRAQTGLVDARKTEYVCVLSRAVKMNGVILMLPCEAANVRHDSLTDADYAAFEKMQLNRILWNLLKKRPDSEAEARTTRSDFLKFAKEICERHPKIALLPLDWRAEQAQMGELTEAGGMPLKTCGALE